MNLKELKLIEISAKEARQRREKHDPVTEEVLHILRSVYQKITEVCVNTNKLKYNFEKNFSFESIERVYYYLGAQGYSINVYDAYIIITW